ncbi:OLC1v1036672C1 [Oldenlandia corymbosa var. corymbosa]|uniref:OLC1v1036672C1 n=1 Tax=Oldenlandia corymbosa var. corymbosa TaxID=529605 RepID=A0AAV1CZ59_OLDCO|nr:OLC1v1036672C1 [Oldenlandia corymbosa var. corymbosa]
MNSEESGKYDDQLPGGRKPNDDQSPSANPDLAYWYRHLPNPPTPADGQPIPFDSDDKDDYDDDDDEMHRDFPLPPLPSCVSTDDFVKMHPFYCARTLEEGEEVEVMNAESIREDQMRAVLKRVWTDCPDEPYEDEGAPAFAFHYGGKETSVGSPSGSSSLLPNMIDLNSYTIATIFVKLEESKNLLQALKNRVFSVYLYWQFPLALRSIVHVAYRARKGQVDQGWGLPATKGEDFVSGKVLGWTTLYDDEDVKRSVQRYGLERYGGFDEEMIF